MNEGEGIVVSKDGAQDPPVKASPIDTTKNIDLVQNAQMSQGGVGFSSIPDGQREQKPKIVQPKEEKETSETKESETGELNQGSEVSDDTGQ